jgi:hypothetical protein
MGQSLDAFIAKWAVAGSSERANEQNFFILGANSVSVTHNPGTTVPSIESRHAQ